MAARPFFTRSWGSGKTARMTYRLIPIGAIALATAACATPIAPTAQDGLTYLRMGQEGQVGGIKVVPLSVLEDSRCPAGVACVWAGRVQISAKVTTGKGSEPRVLTLGEPAPVADGTLLLARVLPARKNRETLAPADYRFAFRFDGGL